MTKYINLPDLVKELKDQGYTLTETENTSLTVPRDLTDTEKKGRQRLPKLTEPELDEAIARLSRKFPQYERRWVDPELPNQKVCLVSFLPAQGATPDADGLYGFLKVRGVFSSEDEADDRAEELINNVDSYHAINHGHVGHPLPLVRDDNDDWCMDVEMISAQKQQKVKDELASDMKKRREKEKKDIEEAKTRAKTLREKEDAEMKGEVDQEERYTTLRVKRANLIFSIYQLMTTMKKYKDTLISTVNLIDEADQKFPEFQNTFLEKYNKAASEVGIPKETNHIVRYMTGPLPFDLSIIPDQVPLIQGPAILPVDVDMIDPRKVAKEMAEQKSA